MIAQLISRLTHLLLCIGFCLGNNACGFGLSICLNFLSSHLRSFFSLGYTLNALLPRRCHCQFCFFGCILEIHLAALGGCQAIGNFSSALI